MRQSKILTRIKYEWHNEITSTKDYFDTNRYAQYRFSDYFGIITKVQRNETTNI